MRLASSFLLSTCRFSIICHHVSPLFSIFIIFHHLLTTSMFFYHFHYLAIAFMIVHEIASYLFQPFSDLFHVLPCFSWVFIVLSSLSSLTFIIFTFVVPPNLTAFLKAIHACRNKEASCHHHVCNERWSHRSLCLALRPSKTHAFVQRRPCLTIVCPSDDFIILRDFSAWFNIYDVFDMFHIFSSYVSFSSFTKNFSAVSMIRNAFSRCFTMFFFTFHHSSSCFTMCHYFPLLSSYSHDILTYLIRFTLFIIFHHISSYFSVHDLNHILA